MRFMEGREDSHQPGFSVWLEDKRALGAADDVDMQMMVSRNWQRLPTDPRFGSG